MAWCNLCRQWFSSPEDGLAHRAEAHGDLQPDTDDPIEHGTPNDEMGHEAAETERGGFRSRGFGSGGDDGE